MIENGESQESILKAKAGHYEIIGETIAKFEFSQNGWNPYSRFLDVDKVDLILRQKDSSGKTHYREVQVKYGKLYEVKLAWERELFDVTSWRFFEETEFESQLDQTEFYVACVFASDNGYSGDIFIFPIKDFVEKVIRSSILSKEKRKVLISRSKCDPHRWFLRRMPRFTTISNETCIEVTDYRRNFALLNRAN